MNTKRKPQSPALPRKNAAPVVQRGSLVALKKGLNTTSKLAIVVSNDVQNEASDYLLVVPLERRAARLKAPFTVDLGRSEGMRDLHTARCDWVTRIKRQEVSRIERASVSEKVLDGLEGSLKVALGFRDFI